jgi:hypothetical protein
MSPAISIAGLQPAQAGFVCVAAILIAGLQPAQAGFVRVAAISIAGPLSGFLSRENS